MKLVLTLDQARALVRVATEGVQDLGARLDECPDPQEEADLARVERLLKRLNLLIVETERRAATRREKKKAF